MVASSNHSEFKKFAMSLVDLSRFLRWSLQGVELSGKEHCLGHLLDLGFTSSIREAERVVFGRFIVSDQQVSKDFVSWALSLLHLGVSSQSSFILVELVVEHGEHWHEELHQVAFVSVG